MKISKIVCPHKNKPYYARGMCKSCYHKKYNLEHKDKYDKGYRRNISSQDKEYRKKKRWADKERFRKRKEWRERNIERENKRGKEYRQKLRRETIEAYGGCCVCCGETQHEFLHLDHTYGGGHTERKRYGGGSNLGIMARLRRDGWPKNDYRILCANCNLSLGHYGYCPHKVERNDKI